MPWKNGQGSTTEIAVCPEGAGLDDFDWRVSMATVRADGPFSLFAGIDRTLSVLQGDGIRLSLEEQPAVELTAASESFWFSGDVRAVATLLGGGITDLNVMSRRDGPKHRVQRVGVDGAAQVETTAPTVLLFCKSGRLEIETSDGPVRLDPHDALLAEAVQPARWRLTGSVGSTVFSIEFF
jgi:hypothetical protein